MRCKLHFLFVDFVPIVETIAYIPEHLHLFFFSDGCQCKFLTLIQLISIIIRPPDAWKNSFVCEHNQKTFYTLSLRLTLSYTWLYFNITRFSDRNSNIRSRVNIFCSFYVAYLTLFLVPITIRQATDVVWFKTITTSYSQVLIHLLLCRIFQRLYQPTLDDALTCTIYIYGVWRQYVHVH